MEVLPFVLFFASAVATDDMYGGPCLVNVYYF